MKESLSAQQEADAQQLADLIADASREDFLRLARLLVAAGPCPFGHTEFKVRDTILAIGARAFETVLAQKKNGYEGASVTCLHCDCAAAYHGDRNRSLVSLCGPVHYTRGYYYCRRCGCGSCPFDTHAGIGPHHLTPAAEELDALAGAVADSFEKGNDLLLKMAAIAVSESTTERTTEDVGLDIAARLQRGEVFGPGKDWQWHYDAKGQSVAYISIDATGTRQQGPGGVRAEGRMAYVACVYNPPELEWLRQAKGQKSPPVQARYLSGLYELADVGPLLRRQAAQVGMERAEVWVALTDGGSGLEHFVQTNFNRPDLVVILDFYHPASYLEKLAHATCPHDEEKALALAQQWCGVLKAEGGATALAVLREWDWPPGKSKEWRKQWADTEQYFGNNVHRMEYPEYLARGWHIGSGVVESACKTVVGQRLKGAGKRWGEDGANALCHVRALYRSERGQWEAYWRDRAAKWAPVQQQK